MYRFSILGLAIAVGLASAVPVFAADEDVDFGAQASDVMPMAVHPGLNLENIAPLGATPFIVYSGNNGERYYSIAVSQQGNLTRFVSPLGNQHLFYEGYVACSTNPAGLLSNAYEYGGEWLGGGSGAGWGVPIVTDTTPLTIVRSSTDSRFTLTQKFAADKNELDFTVTMILKNISGAALSNVRLERYAHVDADNDWNDDWASKNPLKSYIFETRGLALDALSTTGTVETYIANNSISSCGGTTQIGPVGPSDRTMKVGYYFGTMNNGVSKTVKFRYSRL